MNRNTCHQKSKNYRLVVFFLVIKMYFKRLADLRIDHDKGQKEIASYLNMTRQVYGSYERGDRELPVWALIKLADYYHTSTDYILGRTDNPSLPRA